MSERSGVRSGLTQEAEGASDRPMSKVIPHNWEVPARFRERMGASAGKQRTMVHEGHLLLVLHEVPTPGDITRKPIIAWRSPEGAWKSSGAAKAGLLGVRALVESYGKAVADVEDGVERAQRAAEYFAALHAVTPLARAARNLHKTLQDAREAIAGDAELITLRDQAYEVERTAEIVQADAKAGLDFCIAERAEQQAETSEHIAVSGHKLNLLAALFFPITALGSLFGMNFIHGFESRYAPFLFWAIVVFAFMTGFWIRASLDRKPKR